MTRTRRIAYAITMIGLLLGIVVTPINAQDHCHFNEYEDAHQQVLVAIDTGRIDTILDAIQMMQDTLTAMRARCEGYVFISGDYGVNPVLRIPMLQGNWDMHIVAMERIFFDFEELSGDCRGRDVPLSYGFVYIPNRIEQRELQSYSPICVLEVRLLNAPGAWQIEVDYVGAIDDD